MSTASIVTVTVDTTVYTADALFRACYAFTDRCYLFLREQPPNAVAVEFRGKSADDDLDAISGEFGNELINQRLRAIVAAETRAIRDRIVSQAFAEADLHERSP